jgi:hypothetical protein
MSAYWFNFDMDIVSGDTRSIALTFADTVGVATDISGWTFYYKAVNRVTAATTITVANASIAKSDSGTGETDTATIPLDNTITAVAAGKYDQEIAVKIAGEPTTIAKGTLTVHARQTDVS